MERKREWVVNAEKMVAECLRTPSADAVANSIPVEVFSPRK